MLSLLTSKAGDTPYTMRDSAKASQLFNIKISNRSGTNINRPQDYKTIFKLNLAEHEYYPSHKC